MAYERAAKEYEQDLAITRKLPEGRVTSGTIMQRYAGILKVIHRGREAKALMAEAKTFRGKY